MSAVGYAPSALIHPTDYGKPLLVVNVGAADVGSQVCTWLAPLLAAHGGEAPFRLAVGGPRESEAKGIYGKARRFFGQAMDAMP